MRVLRNARNIILSRGIRLRSSWRLELARLGLQCGLVAFFCLCLVYVVMLPLVPELPWNVPGRVYRDTFGPLGALLRLEPPLLERSRFEAIDNLWKPFTFPSESWAGYVQDQGMAWWNWVLGNLFGDRVGEVHRPVHQLHYAGHAGSELFHGRRVGL